MRGWMQIGLVSVVLAHAAGAAGADPQAEIRELRRLLAEQRAYTERLEKRMGELESKVEQAPPPAPVAAAPAKPAKPRPTYDGGFVASTDDGVYSIKLNGLAQMRYTLLVPEQGESSNSFDVAQARLSLGGTLFDPRLSYFFQMQASTLGNENRFTMLDWWGKWTVAPELGVTAGRFVLPYSRQFQVGPARTLLVDRSIADAVFSLGRSVGARAGGQHGRLSYDLAAVNSIRGAGAGGQRNFGGEIAGVGRVGFDILAPYGNVETSPVPPVDPQLSTGLAVGYNPVDEASSAANVMPGDRTVNVTADLGWRWQRATAQAAFYYRQNQVERGGLPDVNDWGWYVQGGFYVVPSRWELAARVAGVDFETQNNPDTAGGQTEYSLGLNYYLYGHNVKVQSDYSLVDTDPFTGESRLDSRVRVQLQLLF